MHSSTLIKLFFSVTYAYAYVYGVHFINFRYKNVILCAIISNFESSQKGYTKKSDFLNLKIT